MALNNPIVITDSEGEKRRIQIVTLIGSNGELIDFTDNAINTNITNDNLDVTIKDEYGEYIDENNPFPVKNENVIVESDIDFDLSSQGSFVGDLRDLFKTSTTGLTDLTVANPKAINIVFSSVVVSVAIGLAATTGTFSNVVVYGIRAGSLVLLNDESGNDTLYDERVYNYTGTGFGGIRIEFHTASQVDVTRVVITRAMTVISQSLGVNLFPEQYFSEFLREPGGSENMGVNGSVTPVEFTYMVPANKILLLRRSFIELTDGNNPFGSQDFGALGALSNGVLIEIVKENGLIVELENWKKNVDISSTMFDFENPFKDGSYVGRWTYERDVGDFITLNPGDTYRMTIRDNLSGVDNFTTKLKGKLNDF